MTEQSINGWPASPQPALIGVQTFAIPGTRRTVRLQSDAAPILLRLATAFDRHVADIDADPLAVWGYNYRRIRPQENDPKAPFSDHASGTAIDLRSDKFPIGKRNMTLRQRMWVRRILKNCDGLVIWGGDYKNDASADEMHFAIAPGVTKQQIVAWRIRHRIDGNGRPLPKR